jgi:hypothetical protein
VLDRIRVVALKNLELAHEKVCNDTVVESLYAYQLWFVVTWLCRMFHHDVQSHVWNNSSQKVSDSEYGINFRNIRFIVNPEKIHARKLAIELLRAKEETMRLKRLYQVPPTCVCVLRAFDACHVCCD